MNRELIVGACLIVLGQVGLGAEMISIVADGEPRAVIVIPRDAGDQTKEAAELLARYVRASSNAQLAIVTEANRHVGGKPVGIYLGSCACLTELGIDTSGLDGDGFVIRGIAPGHIVIAGPTPYGTEFGVCEFLERYVGVRWLLPGDDGDDVPLKPSIDVPAQQVRQEPAFFSRLLSGLHGDAQATWARRNRMHGRVSFHHNLVRLFPPETYTKTHPHFFPIREGTRYLPPTNNTHAWQPCFAAEGIVDEAVKNICRYFDEHPDVSSYSLGVNDSGGHCECRKCQAEDTGRNNFLGLRDVSDRYFRWCNEVIAGVLERHPDKFFGCLAYSHVAQPPSRVELHPRMVPYMTYDRMKWIDPELRAEGHRMTERWQKTSPTLAWYDYIYGTPYCLPRVWFHHMAEYYRFGRAHGVRALYAEAYPNWGEGPKLYISLKLQWNPQLDVDELLDEWYVRAVGADAAPDLAAYYAHWEEFWTRRILKSKWFRKTGQYLNFGGADYLADVTADEIAQSRSRLERVVRKADTPRQKARAELLLLAFEYYETTAIAYWAGQDRRDRTLRTEGDALRLLDQVERGLLMADKRRRLVMEEFAQHPVLVHPLGFSRYAGLRGDRWGADRMQAVLRAIEKSQPR